MTEDPQLRQLIESSRSGLEPGTPAMVGRMLDALADHVADLPDDVLAQMVAASAEVAGWAAGLQARAAGELVRRSQGFTGFEETTMMVSGELRESRRTGREVTVRAAAGLRHPIVIDRLTNGGIDAPRADALLLAGRSLTDKQRAEAIEKYLPFAPERSAAWLKNEMRKFARTLDPEKATRKAHRSRAVFHDVCEDEMGVVTAFLPAADSTAVWNIIDDLAHQMRHDDDPRTLGQLRADVLTSIATGRLVPEHRGSTAGTSADDLPDGSERRKWPIVRLAPTRPVIRVTVPLDALRKHDDAPVEPSGAGGSAAVLDGFGPLSTTTAAQIAFDPESTWHRLVTDPVTGVLTDYSTHAYKPPKRLADAVRLRDVTCRAPGCDTDARWCDLDHIVPYDEKKPRPDGKPGQTRADNLHPLCRTHHRLKTHYGWRVDRDPDTGVTRWTAPTGRQYAIPPATIDPAAQAAGAQQFTTDVGPRSGDPPF